MEKTTKTIFGTLLLLLLCVGVVSAGATSNTYLSDSFSWFNDKVGFGTDTPTETIDVIGNIAVNGTVDGRDISEDIDQAVKTTSSPTFSTIDTGQGANELYDMNQNVLTSSAVTFATVNTGNGANELYGMDQDVKTTSDVELQSLLVNGNLDISGDVSGEYYYRTQGLIGDDGNIMNITLFPNTGITFKLTGNERVQHDSAFIFTGCGETGSQMWAQSVDEVSGTTLAYNINIAVDTATKECVLSYDETSLSVYTYSLEIIGDKSRYTIN